MILNDLNKHKKEENNENQNINYDKQEFYSIFSQFKREAFQENDMLLSPLVHQLGTQ